MKTAFCKGAWVALTLMGAALVGFGVVRGEVAIVLRKAVRICLECIGIG